MEREEGGRWEKLHQLSHLEHSGSCALLPLLYVKLGKYVFWRSAFPLEVLEVRSQDSLPLRL